MVLQGLLRHTSLRLMRLLRHFSQSLHHLPNPLPTNEIHLREHDVHADEEDSQLRHDQLDVQFHQPKTGSAVEGSPGLDEERTAGAADGRVDVVGDDGLAVEGDEGGFVFGEEGGFEAGEGDGGREEDGKGDE